MMTIAAGLCAFTFFVHSFIGERFVVTPMRAQMQDPFASATLLVVWHMVTWTIALLALALVFQPGPLVAALCAGYALIFMAVSQARFQAAIALPQWILLGGVAVFAAVPHPVAVLLGAIALMHFAWALGVTWPEKNIEALALAIIGRKVMPSRLACVVVAFGLCGMIVGLSLPAVRVAIAAVFLLRGTIGFVEPWLRHEIRRTPYKNYSRYMYTPLALSIGIATLLGG